MYRFQHHAQFFTATNLNWIHVLQNDYHKQILLEALKHRVDKNEVTIYSPPASARLMRCFVHSVLCG